MIQEALSMELPVRPESARRAREAVTEFRGQLDGSTYNDLRLVVSELVADVVRDEADGTEAVRVGIEVRDRRIRASVKSRRPQLGERGWGIHLARALGQRWGRHDAERGSIWVEMDLSDNPPPFPSGKSYAAGRVDASRVKAPSKYWEIVHQGFGDGWYRLGMSEGPTLTGALQSWVEEEGRQILPGAYGVRSPDEVAWKPFRVDQSGTIYPIDPTPKTI
jgi:hypothetical protein